MDTGKDISHFLLRIRSEYNTRTAFSFLKDQAICDVTYDDFYRHVQVVSNHLAAKVGKEERVAIIAENSYTWMVYYWGIMLLGKSAVLMDPEMQQEEIVQRLERLGIHFVCAGENGREFGGAKVILMEIPEENSADGPDFHRDNMEIGEKTEATVLFSTGTTGDYKAIRLSQKNIVSAFMPNTAEQAKTVFLPLPFYHSLTINGLITAMTCGCRIFIGSGIKYVLKDMQVFEPEMVYVTPVYMNLFHQKLERHTEDPDILKKIFGKNLRYLVTGGASPQQKVLDALRDRGIRILSSYGSSETFCIASGEFGKMEKCVGHTAPHMTVKIEDGEIVVKGPTVFMGYAQGESPDAWHHTGDLGYVDDKGRLFLTGRKKNLIILSNGKNVSPEHLEAELCAIAQVCEAVVYGENDKICAEIYLGNHPSANARQQVAEQIRQQNKAKPTYYQIQKITFREEPFTHSGVGKIRRCVGLH